MMRKHELHTLFAGDPSKAAEWISAAAAAGIPEAHTRLGRMLLAGEGLPKNEVEAFALFVRAADAGDIEAINMIGRCYENGWGTKIDMPRAADCYRRAAEAGLAWAQYNFGHMLLDGQGIERDRCAAFLWYGRAAEQGHARAMSLMGRCCEEGWGTARDAEAARDWYRKSAEGGYFRGCYNYASILAAEGDVAGARAWFRQALEKAGEPTRGNMLRALDGHPEPAIRELARILRGGARRALSFVPSSSDRRG
jgi:TPR repeat protein